MATNVLNVYGELIGIVVGAVVLAIFAISFSPWVRRPTRLPGGAGPQAASGAQRQGHEQESRGGGSGGSGSSGEVVRADGYVDSFAGVIQEAGGGMPLIVKISIVAIPLWWLLYIIINFSQFLLSIRSYQVGGF